MLSKLKGNIIWGIGVYVLLALSLIAILNLGLFSHNKISDSLQNLNNRINEDIELSSVKNIRLDFIKMDNMMEMYLITNKMFYLNQSDTLAARTKKTITQLGKSKKITAYEAAMLDSLKNTINNKIENLEYIILYEQNQSIEKSINDYLERIPSNGEPILLPKKKKDTRKIKKQSFADRIGLKRKKLTMDSIEKHQLSHGSKLGSDGEIIIEKQDLFDVRQSIGVNPYLEIDKELNDYFMDICRIMETVETDRLDQERITSEKTIKEANQSILLLGITTTLLLILAAIVYFRYIKRLSEVRKNLAESKEVAEEMTLLKEQFMANMSHEIRTPMNAISGFVDQLHSSNLSVIQKRQIEIIQKSITHVLNIINDILDFSKLNAGKITLDEEGFEIKNVVHQTIDLLQPLLAEKHLIMSCSIDEKMPSVLIGDTYRLKQILLNIIGNAIKYTHEGTIDIRLQVKAEGNNTYLVEIFVKDSGIGIPGDELSNIFKEYHMADNSAFNKAGSSGLGLNITKMLVELHHGQIKVDSVLKKGTTVRIKLPYKGGSAVDLSGKNSYLNQPDFLHKKKILVADDEPFNRVLLHNILLKHQAITFEAENGEEVLALLEKDQFDCILMDLKMPDMNGLEASEKIIKSSNPKIKNVPIIALSAAITTENFVFLNDLGVSSFLEKPFKETDLLSTLFKVMMKEPESIQEGSINVAPYESPSSYFDLSELHKQSGGDHSFVNDMLNTLIESTKKGMIEIENGIVKKDWETINITAHRIASPLKFIFATELYEMIKNIENNSEIKGDKNMEIIQHQFFRFKDKFNTLTELLEDYIQKV